MRRVKRGTRALAVNLAQHPLREFTTGEEDLFTDPDREGPAFRPSER